MTHDKEMRYPWNDASWPTGSHHGRLHTPTTRAGLIPMQFFQEIREYTGFGKSDEEELFSLYEYIQPHFSEVVDSFYEALWQNPRTRMVFSGPEQVERLRRTLMSWLDHIFTGPFDEGYFKQRLMIGKVHVDVGLLPHFMFGAMNVVRSRLVGLVLDLDDSVDSRKLKIQAINRILDLELTIMVQSYWDVMMDLKLQMPTALATGLAHEIRNPLNSLNLNVTLMERRLRAIEADTSGFDSVLEVMRSEIRRIRGLTSEIMDFAKPIMISPTWHSSQTLINDIKTMHAPTLEVYNITFDATTHGLEDMWCDVDRLTQILVNLLTNSIEAIGEDGQISLSIHNDMDGTRILLSDDGEGMPPGMRYKIFDLFYTTKAAGTGLGLPIVAKIVDAHDGAIDVVSHKDKGTQFTIYLPRPVK